MGDFGYTSEQELFDETSGANVDARTAPARPAYEGNDPSLNPNWATPGYDNRLWYQVANKSAYEYGGRVGGADAEAGRYRGLASAADTRQGPQMDMRAYDQARGMEYTGRNAQFDALQLQRAALEGRGPSVAALQGQQGLASANQQAATMAAGGRGNAGVMAAQNAAIGYGGGLATAANTQASNARLGEHFATLGGYSGLAGATRGQDFSRAGMDLDMARKQAAFDAQQRALNDQRNLEYERMAQGVYQAQLHAQGAGEAAQQGMYSTNADLAARQAERDAASRNAMTAGLAGAASAGVAGMQSRSDKYDDWNRGRR